MTHFVEFRRARSFFNADVLAPCRLAVCGRYSLAHLALALRCVGDIRSLISRSFVHVDVFGPVTPCPHRHLLCSHLWVGAIRENHLPQRAELGVDHALGSKFPAFRKLRLRTRSSRLCPHHLLSSETSLASARKGDFSAERKTLLSPTPSMRLARKARPGTHCPEPTAQEQ